MKTRENLRNLQVNLEIHIDVKVLFNTKIKRGLNLTMTLS